MSRILSNLIYNKFYHLLRIGILRHRILFMYITEFFVLLKSIVFTEVCKMKTCKRHSLPIIKNINTLFLQTLLNCSNARFRGIFMGLIRILQFLHDCYTICRFLLKMNNVGGLVSIFSYIFYGLKYWFFKVHHTNWCEKFEWFVLPIKPGYETILFTYLHITVTTVTLIPLVYVRHHTTHL